MDFIEAIRFEIEKITLFNVSVMESPNGPEWVRIQTYPCCSIGDDDVSTGDFKAEEIWSVFIHNQVYDETTLWDFFSKIMPPSPLVIRQATLSFSKESGKGWLQFLAEDT
jgi:hypothetical protein